MAELVFPNPPEGLTEFRTERAKDWLPWVAKMLTGLDPENAPNPRENIGMGVLLGPVAGAYQKFLPKMAKFFQQRPEPIVTRYSPSLIMDKLSGTSHPRLFQPVTGDATPGVQLNFNPEFRPYLGGSRPPALDKQNQEEFANALVTLAHEGLHGAYELKTPGLLERALEFERAPRSIPKQFLIGGYPPAKHLNQLQEIADIPYLMRNAPDRNETMMMIKHFLSRGMDPQDLDRRRILEAVIERMAQNVVSKSP